TGINEGDAWVLLAPKARYDRSVLFLRARDPEHERWTGPRDPISPALRERYGVDRVARGRPDGVATAAAMGTDCVALVAPVGALHDGRLQAGDLVVVDAAAEYGRYAADVTRTYPVSGRFTDEQARVYRAVYQAQEDIFAAVKPGVSMADLQKVAEASLKRAGY